MLPVSRHRCLRPRRAPYLPLGQQLGITQWAVRKDASPCLWWVQLEVEQSGGAVLGGDGAMADRQVGSIVFTGEVGHTYDKGDELGYFAFGGSTVIALFGPAALAIDSDLLHNRCALAGVDASPG